MLMLHFNFEGFEWEGGLRVCKPREPADQSRVSTDPNGRAQITADGDETTDTITRQKQGTIPVNTYL